MNVTVVIPAYNEVKALPYCLEALCNQVTTHMLQIIVVDNASTDNTSDLAKNWKDRLQLRVISEPKLGRGQARSTGFAKANTDIILSTDADSIVPVDWVEILVNTLLSSKNAAAVTSSSYISDGSMLTNWTMKLGMPVSLRLYRLIMGNYMLTGASFAIWRKAYLASGGFNTSCNMLDDIDLSFRVARVGQIVYLANPRVNTEGDIFRNGFIKGFYYYFRYFPALLKRYGLKRKLVKVAKYDN
jgi:biofilm PGA synthesis N-glycosyltransferase PgaC